MNYIRWYNRLYIGLYIYGYVFWDFICGFSELSYTCVVELSITGMHTAGVAQLPFWDPSMGLHRRSAHPTTRQKSARCCGQGTSHFRISLLLAVWHGMAWYGVAWCMVCYSQSNYWDAVASCPMYSTNEPIGYIFVDSFKVSLMEHVVRRKQEVQER